MATPNHTTAAPSRKRAKLDMDYVLEMAEEGDGTGFCLACGAEQGGCEPDARRYKCDACGEMRVYGAEEIILMMG